MRQEETNRLETEISGKAMARLSDRQSFLGCLNLETFLEMGVPDQYLSNGLRVTRLLAVLLGLTTSNSSKNSEQKIKNELSNLEII